jgi:aryl-alcohol dehydrogenase-like predicted oxidoreductase
MYYADADFEVVEAAKAVADAHAVTPAQISLAWILQKPGVVAPIIGATKMPHLEQAIGSLDVRLSEEDIQALEAPYRPHPILGHS